jgi:hypothetical protein
MQISGQKFAYIIFEFVTAMKLVGPPLHTTLFGTLINIFILIMQYNKRCVLAELNRNIIGSSVGCPRQWLFFGHIPLRFPIALDCCGGGGARALSQLLLP